ncbi:MAG: hypothetical protein U0165_16390 [Polyangiaceae bacterium]
MISGTSGSSSGMSYVAVLAGRDAASMIAHRGVVVLARRLGARPRLAERARLAEARDDALDVSAERARLTRRDDGGADGSLLGCALEGGGASVGSGVA